MTTMTKLNAVIVNITLQNKIDLKRVYSSFPHEDVRNDRSFHTIK